MRLIDAVEKARIVLSDDSEALIDVDNIVGNESLEMTIEIGQFHEVCASHIQRFEEFLRKIKNATGQSIHFVELLGDCIRTPVFLNKVTEVLECETKRTTHS